MTEELIISILKEAPVVAVLVFLVLRLDARVQTLTEAILKHLDQQK